MGTYPVGLISALAEDIYRESGYSYECLKALPAYPPDADHRLVAAVSLSKSFTKKFLPSETTKQDTACLVKFLDCNLRSKEWQLRLNSSLDEELWGSFKRELDDFFHPGGYPLIPSLDSIFFNGKVGPGASVGALNGDFYTKIFASPLTSTSQGLVVHYLTNIWRWPEWNNGETIRRLHHSEPQIVQGSRLSFVPKNDTISRSICTEPSLNMFYQLGLGTLLTERLRSYFRIDLSTQPDINASLASIGSISGVWSTIDLESASDSISLGLCREVLPSCVYSMLLLLRSRETTINGKTHVLSMVSSMGNGFTFPLQTLLFAAMVKAVYSSFNVREQVCAFGDDIVIRDFAYLRMCRLLELAGFRVNTDKSFNEGPFRESCGHDYFLGKEVRGVYMKRFATLQDSYALINALNEFSAKTGLTLSSVMTYLRARVDCSIEIPLWEDPSSGIRMPLSMVKTRRVSGKTHGTLYSKYVYKARRAQPGGMIRGKRIIYNMSGLLIALLSGMALSSGLPLRGEGRWVKKRSSCSFWDSLQASPGIPARYDLRRLETATYYNLMS